MVKLKFTEGFFIGIALLYIFIRFKSIQKPFTIFLVYATSLLFCKYVSLEIKILLK